MVNKKRTPRLPDESRKQLIVCVQDLIDATELYDQGKFTAINHASATLRTIFYNSNNSHSLIDQINGRDHLKMLSLSNPTKQDIINIGPIYTARFKGSLLAPTDYYSTFLFYPGSEIKPKKIIFSDWWHKPMIKFGQGSEYCISRGDIITIMANQDGGVHFDPDINATYQSLKNGESLFAVKADTLASYIVTGNSILDGSWTNFTDIQVSLLRQIVHEAIISLVDAYHLHQNYVPDFDHNWKTKLNFIGGHPGIRRKG